MSSTITPATITSLYDGGWRSDISASQYVRRYVSISGDTISFYSPQTSGNQAAYTHPHRIWGTKSNIFDNTFA